MWLYAQYDRRQKEALYTMPNAVSLDAEIADEDAQAASWALRRSRTGSHDLGIEASRAGVRGVAAASAKYGDANLFVTITMSESDIPWLGKTITYIGAPCQAYDEPGVCAYYFSHLVRVLIVEIFGDERTFGGLTFFAYRLENQSQRANKLHAHCILRVEACEGDINKSLTADLSDLCPSFRVNYEPRARHHCGEKCTGQNPAGTFDSAEKERNSSSNTSCNYGFPVTEYAPGTFCREKKKEKETVYRRSAGMERVVPFYPLMKAVYPAHGADMVMSSTVMAAYTGKVLEVDDVQFSCTNTDVMSAHNFDEV